MEPEPSGVLIIDPLPVVRQGILSAVNQEWPDAEVSTATDFDAALELLGRSPAHVVITEFRIGETTVIDFLGAVPNHGSAPRCLVFSALDEIHTGIPSIRAGASGFLGKSAPLSELVAAVRSVLAGRPFLSARLAQALANGSKSTPSPIDQLTRRESEVFTHLGHGLTVSQIASRLGLSVKTIEAHREHIKTKLGLQSASQVTAAASRWTADISI